MDELRVFPAKVLVREQGNSPVEGAYIFSAEVSSTRLDAYFTKMDAATTLRNFASDAKTGVPFLDSHNQRQLGYGRSYDARTEQHDGVDRVVVDFYTVPGIRFNGQTYGSTDDFIRATQSGLVGDVSVGFRDGQLLCDICGKEMESFGFFGMWPSCDHFPGEKYIIDDNVVLSTYTIKDAHLSEVSAVFDGATPHAQIIQRAMELNQVGQLDSKLATGLEMRYRIKLNKVEIPPKKERKMDEFQEFLKENELTVEKLRAILAENEQLRAKAEEAETYRKELIESAIEAGIRAVGDKFPVDTYRSMFENATPQHIKTMRDTWNAQQPFEPGRKTKDETTEQKQPPQRVPNAAYKS